jgi:hypothetical protein
VTFWAFLWQVLTPCTPCLAGGARRTRCHACPPDASVGLPSRQRSRLLRPHCYLDTSESSWFGLEPG